MDPQDDPEKRIRELERPLAEAARASESGSPPPAGPPQRHSGNRMWWILGLVIVVGALALAGGIAAFAAHQLSGVRSVIGSPGGTSSAPRGPATSRTSTAPPPGAMLSVSGINENRAIACNDNMVSVSGVANTVVITGHCAKISVSGVRNSVTVGSVDAVDASGLDNKVTYHSGEPEVSNSGGSNVVKKG